ncbi:hypothetical protein E2C01_049678 [Portunus trituberculatus]|uniref:Uncharacterized protein n=1 Tax=Portunus trituberculatus TaxID=210409 RepID=A0A5B7GEI4_PORTR|nr:hypothetical protein [Portunus trituberculatus]
MFLPAREPTPFRLKQLVEDMYWSMTDRTDWSKPFTLGLESLTDDDASQENSPLLGGEAIPTGCFYSVTERGAAAS